MFWSDDPLILFNVESGRREDVDSTRKLKLSLSHEIGKSQVKRNHIVL